MLHNLHSPTDRSAGSSIEGLERCRQGSGGSADHLELLLTKLAARTAGPLVPNRTFRIKLPWRFLADQTSTTTLACRTSFEPLFAYIKRLTNC